MGVLLTKVPMAASMSYTQEWRDRFQEEAVAALRGVVYSDKAGTVYVDESDDAGATSSATATIVVAAATTTEIPWTALTKRWYRFRHANGVAAQASFVLIQETADFEKTNYLKAMGIISDTAVTNPASSGSFIAFLKGIVKQLQGGGTGAAPVSIDQTTDGTTNKVRAFQPTHDNLNLNANMQVANTDVGAENPVPTTLTGSSLAQQLTEADAVANVLTFAANISAIEIYHEELTWQDFIVNGLTIKIPAGGYRTPVAGVAAATVTIPAGISCLVGRLT